MNRTTKIEVSREVDLEEIAYDLEGLDNPNWKGGFNICYQDGYYAKSLERKHGITIKEMRALLASQPPKRQE